MLVHFSDGRTSFGKKQRYLLAFEIATGEQMGKEQVLADDESAARPLGRECVRDRLDEDRDDQTDTVVIVLECGEDIVAAGLDPATAAVRWRTRLPLGRIESDSVDLTGAAYGRAMVLAAERLADRTNRDQLLELDIDTGEVSVRLRLSEHFTLGLVDPGGVALVPNGFCAWSTGSLDLELACFKSGTGAVRWSRRDPVTSDLPPAARVLDNRTLLLVTDANPSRWIAYQLSGGRPLFDLDQPAPIRPVVAYHDGGVLALVSIEPAGWVARWRSTATAAGDGWVESPPISGRFSRVAGRGQAINQRTRGPGGEAGSRCRQAPDPILPHGRPANSR